MNPRYDRQSDIIPDQEALRSKKVLVVGAGGLGSSVLYHLASAGVGSIGIVDDDVLSISNLNRQILYDESGIGMRKATLAANRLSSYNSDLEIIPYMGSFIECVKRERFDAYDLIVDCVDNFETRKQVSDVAVSLAIPLIEGGIEKDFGFVQIVIPGVTACFNCFDSSFPLIERQVLGASAAVIGSFQALEAIKRLHETDLPTYSYLAVDLKDYCMEKSLLKPRETCKCAMGQQHN